MSINFKTPCWGHQWLTFKKGVELLEKKGSFAILSETGTGKSKSILDIYTYFKDTTPNFRGLIVCPKSVLIEWPQQIREHSNLSYQVLDGTWLERTAKLDLSVDLYLINYEGLKVVPKIFLKQTWPITTLDESQRIKNYDSNTTKTALLLGAVSERRILSTGTPITQSLEEVWSQWMYLNRGTTFGGSLAKFRSLYMKNVGHHHTKWVPKKRAKIAIWRKMINTGVRFEKMKVLDLPPKTYSQRHCQLEGDQRDLYLQILNSDMPIQLKLNKLAQVAGGFIYETDDFEERNARYCNTNAKLILLREVLEEIGNHHPVIILCRFIAEKDLLKRIYQAKCLEVEEWKASSSATYLIETGSKAAMGLNLQRAHYLIYYSSSYSVHDRIQSEGRIWRGIQQHSCHYIDLFSEHTTDNHVLRVLQEGRNIASITEEELLEEVEREKHGLAR